MNFNYLVGLICGIILTSVVVAYKSTTDNDSVRRAAAVCDDNPKYYSGFLHSDGVTNRCFRRSSQYPYRITQFVLVGE